MMKNIDIYHIVWARKAYASMWGFPILSQKLNKCSNMCSIPNFLLRMHKSFTLYLLCRMTFSMIVFRTKLYFFEFLYANNTIQE